MKARYLLSERFYWREDAEGTIYMKDYYKTLGINREANEQEVKKTYRRLVLVYHPDRNPGDGEAEEKFKEITEAYEVLSNREKRAQYDLYNAVRYAEDMNGFVFAAGFPRFKSDFSRGCFRRGKRRGRGRRCRYEVFKKP